MGNFGLTRKTVFDVVFVQRVFLIVFLYLNLSQNSGVALQVASTEEGYCSIK
jgi:hypothetical protein